MLVNNKFIYLSLPRCASTSFLITCLRNQIDLVHYNPTYDLVNNPDFSSDNEKLADDLFHGHEKLFDLKRKFGYDYPIVGIRRDRHQRFLSLWRHIIDLTSNLSHLFAPELSQTLKKLTVSELLSYKTEDLIPENKDNLIDNLISKWGISKYINEINGANFKMMIFITINPLSYYHNNDSNIIWFNYENLNDFENWVSQILDRPFKLEKSNSSKHYETNVTYNEEFIKKYNQIYDYFDMPKNTKSMI